MPGDHLHVLERIAEARLGISPERVKAAAGEAKVSGRSLLRTLVELGIVDEVRLLEALAEHLGLPFIALVPDEVTEEAVAEVPANVVQHYGVMPVSLDGGRLRMAVEDPLNEEMLDELGLVLGRPVTPVISPRESIARAVRRHYGVGAETIERLIAEDADGLVVEPLEGVEGDLAEQSRAEQASVVKLVNQILLDAIRERATDIHLEPYEGELRVRYRVDGVLREASVPPAARHFRSAIVSRIKIMANLDIAEKRLPQDGRAPVRMADEQFDLRISILPVPEGEAVNIRVLPRRPVLGDLPSLGLGGEDLDKMQRLLDQPHGIVLVTGPTGSGKTTTLYACLTKINRPETKILTIEDPIEYRIRGIQQMQVSPEIGFTFARALRSMLRHDPDVMLIGEIRDSETARITIRTALTGHLVFSTLHTNDAASAATRLVDIGIEPYLISSSVIGIVAQRLVRTICPRCKKPYEPEERALEELGLRKETNGPLPLYKGAGCEHCRLTGYRGRTAIYEMLMVDAPVRELIMAEHSADRVRSLARQRGMRTLREAGWEKVRAGLTTVEEVLRVTQDEAPGS